jgi:hypothetical protein
MTTLLFEAGGGGQPTPTAVPADVSALRLRLAELRIGGQKLRLLPLLDGSGRTLALLSPGDLQNPDLDRLGGRAWMPAVELQFDAQHRIVNARRLVGQGGIAQAAADGMALPEYWRSNMLLDDPDDPLAATLRRAVLAAGWDWQPRLWPWASLWRDPWRRWLR